VLQFIEELAGVKIRMPKQGGGSILVEGDNAPAVQTAVTIIQDLATKGYSVTLAKAKEETVLEIPIPSERSDKGALGRIIGKQGMNIKTIQAKCGVQVITPEQDPKDKKENKEHGKDKKSNKAADTKEKKIVLIGSANGCATAKAAILSLISEGCSSTTHEGWTKLEIELPKEDIPALVGKDGDVIKRIQKDCNVKINIPREANQNVSVVGLPADVDKAEKEILTILRPEDEEEEEAGPWAEGIQEIVF